MLQLKNIFSNRFYLMKQSNTILYIILYILKIGKTLKIGNDNFVKEKLT